MLTWNILFDSCNYRNSNLHKATYKRHTSNGISSQIMQTVLFLFDTGAGHKLVCELQILPEWNHHIHCGNIASVRTAAQQPSRMHGKILLYIQFGALIVRIWFGIVPNLAVDILLSSSFIDRIFCGIFLSEQKVVPWQCHAVPILDLPKHFRLKKIQLLQLSSPPWRHSQDRYQSCRNANTNPHSTSNFFTTSRLVSCDGYQISLQYSHRRAQDIRKNLSTDVCRQWCDRFLTISTAPYPYFQFFIESDAPTQTHCGSVCHRAFHLRDDFFTFMPSTTSRPNKVESGLSRVTQRTFR